MGGVIHGGAAERAWRRHSLEAGPRNAFSIPPRQARAVRSMRLRLLVLMFGAALLSAAAALRGAEYDEAYSLFLLAGTPRPAWPATPFRAGAIRTVLAGHASLPAIAS